MVRERDGLCAVLLGCGATIVAAERRALGRNRVLGFISGSTAGARAVRRSGSPAALAAAREDYGRALLRG